MSADGNTENRDFTETGRLLWRMCYAQSNNNTSDDCFRYWEIRRLRVLDKILKIL